MIKIATLISIFCLSLALQAQTETKFTALNQSKQKTSNESAEIKATINQNSAQSAGGTHSLITYQAKPQKANKFVVKNELNIFPNPTNGALQINFKKETSGTISIFDMQGKLIFTSSMVNQMQHQIDLPQHYQGIFALVFQNGQEKLVAKFVKR